MVHASEPGGAEVWKYIQQAYVGWKAPLGRGLTLEAGILHGRAGLTLAPLTVDQRGLVLAGAVATF